jgi:hypothetical protein
LLVVLVVLTQALSARAEDDAIPAIRLRVRAVPECTSRAGLAQRILTRSPRIQFVDDASAPQVEAEFAVQASGNVVADLLLLKPGAKPSARRVVARSCAQAADAAALIIAVSFDPEALTEDRTTAEPDLPTATSDSGRSDADVRAQPKGDVSEKRGPEASAPEPDVAPFPATTRTASLRYRLGVHVAGQAMFGPAPGVLPGVGVYALAGFAGEFPWSFAVQLGALHVGRAGFEQEGGSAAFTVDAAALDVCLLRFGTAAFQVRGCGSGLLGRLAVEGTETRNPAGLLNRPFAMAGAAAIASVQLGATIELVGRVAAGSTLVRDSFEFTPSVFHTAAPVTLLVSVGIGVHSR